MFTIEDVKGLDKISARKIGNVLGVDRYCLDRAAEEDEGSEKYEQLHVREVQIAMLEDMGILKKG